MLLALHLLNCFGAQVLTHWKLMRGDSCALHQRVIGPQVLVFEVLYSSGLKHLSLINCT